MCSSSQNDGNPNACSFSEKEDCEDQAEYLAEEARVKSWKLHNEIHKNKRDVSVVLDDMGTLEKAVFRDRQHKLESGNASLTVERLHT